MKNNRIRVRRLVCLGVLALLSCSSICAGTLADSGLVLTACPSGIYVELGRLPGFTTSYRVERRALNGQYATVGQFIPCGNGAVLFQRMNRYAHMLPGYALPSKSFADTLWRVYRSPGRRALLAAPFPLLQLSLGASFLDSSARMGMTYQYRIIFSDSLSPMESGPVSFMPEKVQYAPMKLQRVLPEKRHCQLEWGTSVAHAAPFFEVWRGQPGVAGGFQQIAAVRGLRYNKRADSLTFLVIDSSAVMGITYDYYLVAKDYLGNSGNHSDTARVQAGGRQNVPAIYGLTTHSDSNGIRLSWRRPAPNTAMQHIVVLRSVSHDTGYVLLTLVPLTDTSYTDRTATGGRRYFYQLLMQGGVNYSMPTPRVAGIYTGAVRLLAPYGLEAIPMAKAVRLRWKYKGVQDIGGFEVYRSITPQGKMQLISGRIRPVSDTGAVEFVDTTAGTDQVSFYYAVVAVSHTSSLSPMSNIVTGGPSVMDRVKAPAGLRYIRLNDSVVSITWPDLQRGNPSIASYGVYRQGIVADSGEAGELVKMSAENEYIDTLRPGETRWYRVVAMNRGGISSRTSPVLRISGVSRMPLPPGSVRVYQQGRKVMLDWDGTLDGGIASFFVYRADNNGQVLRLASVDAAGQSLRYIDEGVSRGRVYYYYVSSVSRSRVESRRSEEVHIRME